MMQQFLAFSAEITAFSTFELVGTGQAQAYLDAMTSIIGTELTQTLLDTWEGLRGEEQPVRDKRLRHEIFGDEKLGPIARNIIKMWYAGSWTELPNQWMEAYGPLERDASFVVAPESYTEALLWPAIGANPPGAKAPGYGSWAEPPRIPGYDNAPFTLYPEVTSKGSC